MSRYVTTLNEDLILYNQSAMQQASADIQNTSKLYKETIDSLDGELRQSLAQWEAGPRDLYEQIKRKWDQQAADRAAQLSGIGPRLEQIDEIYQATHRGVTQTWS